MAVSHFRRSDSNGVAAYIPGGQRRVPVSDDAAGRLGPRWLAADPDEEGLIAPGREGQGMAHEHVQIDGVSGAQSLRAIKFCFGLDATADNKVVRFSVTGLAIQLRPAVD